MSKLFKFGVVVCSARKPRAGLQISQFVKSVIEKEHPNASLKLIDLAEWDLPLFNEPLNPGKVKSTEGYTHELTKKWSREILAHDGFVFVTPEYNRSIVPYVKNAVDYLFFEWKNRASMVVSYGFVGGASGGAQLCGLLKSVGTSQPVDPLVSLRFPKGEFGDKCIYGKDLGLSVDGDVWRDEQQKIVAKFRETVELLEAKKAKL